MFESPARSLFKDGTASSSSADRESAAALLASASAPDDVGDDAASAGQRSAEKLSSAKAAAAVTAEKELSPIRRRGSWLGGNGGDIVKSSKYANEEDRHWYAHSYVVEVHRNLCLGPWQLHGVFCLLYDVVFLCLCIFLARRYHDKDALRFFFMIFLTGSFFFVELVWGMMIGSLALV